MIKVLHFPLFFVDIYLHNESEDSEKSDNYTIYPSLNQYSNWESQDYSNLPDPVPARPRAPILPPRDYQESGDVTPDILRKARVIDIDSIPSDLNVLSHSEVIDCLNLLNIETDKFKKRNIDGTTLLSLDDVKVLQTIFELPPIQAADLIRFIRGWRPKT